MLTFLDLFAGCGGFSVGLAQAGLQPIGEIEIDSWAADTLRQNLRTSKIMEQDVRSISDDDIGSFAGVDLIVGGVPCQGFSVAGPTQFRVQDPRNELIHWFMHWVKVLRPRIAIVENVPNILTRKNPELTVPQLIERELSGVGFSVRSKILNSADFGVPQLRRRAFIVATLPGVRFNFPEPTHASSSNGLSSLFACHRPYTTVIEAISDLPKIEAGEGEDGPAPYGTGPQNTYQEEMRRGADEVFNHIAMKHTRRVIERFKIIKPGESLKDVPLEHGQVAYRSGEKVRTPFKYNNYRLHPERPALAIPAAFQSLFVHPIKHRNLTAREAARLMGFPDSFVFKGQRTTMSWEKNLSQYNQIGNAVCPPVARAIGIEVKHALASSQQELSRSIVPFSSKRLVSLRQSVPALPAVQVVRRTQILHELSRLGENWLSSDAGHFARKGFSIPAAALPSAIIFATAHQCPVCSRELAPFGKHAGRIAFLISKEDLASLQENHQDHGLDYHLRSTLGIDHEVGHLVGEQLAELGIADLREVVNERTGRRVRGIQVREHNLIPDAVVQGVFAAIRIPEAKVQRAR